MRSDRLLGVVFMAAACSSGPSNLPPVLTGGGAEDPPECVVGVTCMAGDYCIAPADAGCAYLYCGGPIWECAPEGGASVDGGTAGDAPQD